MNKEFQRKLLINIGLLLAVILVLGGFVVFLSRDIKSLSSSIVQMRRELSVRGEEIALLFDLKTDFQKAEGYFSVLDNALPKRENLYVFSQDVHRFGEMNNLDRPSFSFGEEILPAKNLPGRVKFTIFASGVYNDILNFLTYLERSRYFVSIENLDMTHRDNRFNAQLAGEVFFR